MALLTPFVLLTPFDDLGLVHNTHAMTRSAVFIRLLRFRKSFDRRPQRRRLATYWTTPRLGRD
ncbi:hypothetical protein [Acidiferrobacter thiooxydans]|uniref:Uncharacterized protein n=1 Tax=Acidiferrobacter thiooxydans TaxID=163359 RepID=A0A1C2FXP8_9GAMM|nr:hypothetical protein [Acidiferrobacter thiooxydans]RCN56317.1 hypothetical protein C4900_10785 [Acidiferrobacter thiooxydans]UEN98938.1 hypothetical protein A9R16_010935 [Acidiferrobacter thiooxydans]